MPKTLHAMNSSIAALERIGPTPFRVLCMSLSLVICGKGQAAGIEFERYELATGVAEQQTVLTGFLLGGNVADLAVVNAGRNRTRWLHVYSLSDAGWKETTSTLLRSQVQLVDLANVGDDQCLITYDSGSLACFDPESGVTRTLATARLGVQPSQDGGIPHVDVTRDFNGDSRDDLVVPGVSGFSVLIQDGDGTFADPIALGPAAVSNSSFGGDGYRYDPWSLSRIHEIDYNGDGRPDLVFWDEDHFVVHLQQVDGRFSSTTETFTTSVAFDSDDPAALAAPMQVRGRQADGLVAGAMSGRVLHSLQDMNGDGVADLVVFSLKGGDSDLFGQTSELWDMSFGLHVHFGIQAAGELEFSKEPGAELLAEGIPFEIGIHDFDGDGQKDVMVTKVKPGVFKSIGMLIGAFFTQSVSFDMDFYRMENGTYPEKRNRRLKLRTASMGESGENAALFPPVLIGDVNGDGRSDVLMGWGREELRIYAGVQGSGLFEQRPQKIKVEVPPEEFAWLTDLNGDGKDDVVLHHRSTDGPNRVTLLIAR